MIRLMKFGAVPPEEIFARAVPEIDVSAVVADILRNVRTRGDAALREYNEKFEKAKTDALEVKETVVPISARFIANKASYEFKREKIDALCAGLARLAEEAEK